MNASEILIPAMENDVNENRTFLGHVYRQIHNLAYTKQISAQKKLSDLLATYGFKEDSNSPYMSWEAGYGPGNSQSHWQRVCQKSSDVLGWLNVLDHTDKREFFDAVVKVSKPTEASSENLAQEYSFQVAHFSEFPAIDFETIRSKISILDLVEQSARALKNPLGFEPAVTSFKQLVDSEGQLSDEVLSGSFSKLTVLTLVAYYDQSFRFIDQTTSRIFRGAFKPTDSFFNEGPRYSHHWPPASFPVAQMVPPRQFTHPAIERERIYFDSYHHTLDCATSLIQTYKLIKAVEAIRQELGSDDIVQKLVK